MFPEDAGFSQSVLSTMRLRGKDLLFFMFSGLLVFCSMAPPTMAQESNQEFESSLRIFRTADRTQISFAELVQAIGELDAVFIGETHLDEMTHRVELNLYRALLEQRGNKVVLAMEMFEKDVQPVLDQYLRGELPEADFRRRARAWGNYVTGYRSMIELAREHSVPVVASNTPLTIRRKVGFGGQSAFEDLDPQDRALMPNELLPNGADYWERFFRATRSHGHMMLQNSGEDFLYSTQSLWDNTMGDSCAQALDAHPGHLVYHVNGGFHTAYRDGTAAQFRSRKPEAKTGTIDIQVRSDLTRQIDCPEEAQDVADYVVYVQSRGRGLQNGTHGIRVSHEIKYRLFVPPQASEDQPVPLLIWLPTEGVSAKESLKLWRLTLENRTAIAVVETPYPQIEADGSLGGRWFWSHEFETFSADVGRVGAGLAGMIEYLVHYFPIEGTPILAGEGAGATTLVSAALHSLGEPATVLAMHPSRYAQLHLSSLPLTAPEPNLKVYAAESSKGFWESELEEYREIGMSANLEVVEAPLGLETMEAAILKQLGEEPKPMKETSPMVGVYATSSPLARHWARSYAKSRSQESQLVVPVSWDEYLLLDKDDSTKFLAMAAPGEPLGAFQTLIDEGRATRALELGDFANTRHIPLSPGSFGGTTVLHLPYPTEEQKSFFTELAESDAIKKRSRFASLRVSWDGDEGRDLGAVLSSLVEEGKSQVLIVPLCFCANADQMRSLREKGEAFVDRLETVYSPGIGGSLTGRF